MNIPNSLFHIEKEHLKEKLIFPFHLYVHNPQSKSYSLFLPANCPLDADKMQFIDLVESKGGELAIDNKQKKTFLHHMDLNEEDIASLQERELTDFEKKRLERIAILDATKKYDDSGNEVKEIYDLKKGLNECLENDNFLPMIKKAKEEVEIFPLNISPTVSLAAYLAEKLLTEDNFTNRVVAISYFMTKNMDMTNEETLSDLVCAAFFVHLGYTQLEIEISHIPEQEFTEEQKKAHKKHPGYSHHMLLKSKLEISERVKNIIFQHHERIDGSGYPNQKHSDFIDILALVVGSVTHVLEFSTGKITGNKVPISSVISRLKNKSFTPGLEFEFGDKIYENLINIITVSTPDSSEAA